MAGAVIMNAVTLSAAETLPKMPETVTSFGAVTSDGWLYVFGGHKGERHDYNQEMVSGSFNRLNLKDGKSWEKLPSAAASQGVPLVAHDGFVYRIGGMAARNHANEKQDLYSTNIVQRFDVKQGKWENVASLPAVRSSHDAVVVGNKIYVAGGWQLDGGTNKPVWPKNALVLDLANTKAGWKEFPQPFQRRALALATTGSKVFCIGGMDSNNEPTTDVEVYDIAAGTWSEGPSIPAGKYKGFSCSAIAQDGRIYVTAFKGDLLRLSADEKSWEVVGKLEHPRMAHRIVTASGGQLIVLGGEDGEEKRGDLELLTPTAKPLAVQQVSADNAPAAAAAH